MSAESTIELLSSLSQDYQTQYRKLHAELKESIKKGDEQNVLRIAKQMNDLLKEVLDEDFRLDRVSDTCGARVKRTLKNIGLCFLSGLATVISFSAAPALSSATPMEEMIYGERPDYTLFAIFLISTLKLAGDIISSAKSLEMRQNEDLQKLRQNYWDLSQKITYLHTLNKSGSLTMGNIKEKFEFGYNVQKKVSRRVNRKKSKSAKKSRIVRIVRINRKSAKKSKGVKRKSVKQSKNRK